MQLIDVLHVPGSIYSCDIYLRIAMHIVWCLVYIYICTHLNCVYIHIHIYIYIHILYVCMCACNCTYRDAHTFASTRTQHGTGSVLRRPSRRSGLLLRTFIQDTRKTHLMFGIDPKIMVSSMRFLNSNPAVAPTALCSAKATAPQMAAKSAEQKAAEPGILARGAASHVYMYMCICMYMYIYI